MLLHVAHVLDTAELARIRAALADAAWADGRVTAGHQSAAAKRNRQLPESDPLAAQLGRLVLAALSRHATFFAGALPRRIFPPLFNAYAGGEAFDRHIDNAIRYPRHGVDNAPVRTDLSATLFLSDPADYDGGELVVEDSFGEHAIKLPAGDLVLYPAGSLHRVAAVTRGERIASFFWIQSLVRSSERRRLLFDLDVAIQGITQRQPDAPERIALAGVYHNLLREWSDV